jgi:dihydroflavonol-4-reductase
MVSSAPNPTPGPALRPVPHRPTRVDVLVTGATGLVGNNVVRMLVSRGESVRAFVRSRKAAERCLAGLPVETIEGALGDHEGVQAAVDGSRIVIHAAAMVHCGWRHEDEMAAANVDGTRIVAAAARRAGARFVHVSSVDAIGLRADGVPADEDTPPGGMPECPYVVTKRSAEEAVHDEIARGLDAVIVNPVYMLGPWDWKPSSGRMLLEVGAGKGLFAPSGGNDFVDVRDVAGGILAAVTRGQLGRRYILGGHSMSYLDAWRVFARIAGRMQPLGTAPRGIVQMAGLAGDLASLFTARELPVNSAATRMSMLPHNFSYRRAQAELGYAFRSLDETVADAWEWFVTRGYAKAVRGREVMAR